MWQSAQIDSLNNKNNIWGCVADILSENVALCRVKEVIVWHNLCESDAEKAGSFNWGLNALNVQCPLLSQYCDEIIRCM